MCQQNWKKKPIVWPCKANGYKRVPPEQEKFGQEPEDISNRAHNRQHTGKEMMCEEERSWRILIRRQDKAERMLREGALEVKSCPLITVQTTAFCNNSLFGTGMFGSPD
jgi:hypothetical protein